MAGRRERAVETSQAPVLRSRLNRPGNLIQTPNPQEWIRASTEEVPGRVRERAVRTVLRSEQTGPRKGALDRVTELGTRAEALREVLN